MREEKGREWWNQALVLIQLGFQLRALYQETKSGFSNGALGLILELGLGDKQLCLDYEFHT